MKHAVVQSEVKRGLSADRPKLSGIIIARNEAKNLSECLKLLAFCDEIVVVDNGSTDCTAEIAASAGARILEKMDFEGFGRQKQAALNAARSEWVLSIDADERVTPELAAEIETAITHPANAGYTINRRTYFLGKFLKHGGWYPDRVLRLARRDAARFTDDLVHEQMIVNGSVGDLAHDLLHLSYRTIDDVFAKQRRYTQLSALVRRDHGTRGGLTVALSSSFFAFVKHYILQGGVLDGGHGLVAAISKSQETFWRYLAVGWEQDGG